MITVGDIISYMRMCAEEGTNLQRGMNYRIQGRQSIFLMSVRNNAPYKDAVEDDGKVLIYEGHDVPKRNGIENPKLLDQEMKNPSGTLTQNGLFYRSVERYHRGEKPENVKVYEKIKDGIWAYSGIFELIDAWIAQSKERKIFKFKLHITEESSNKTAILSEMEHNRIIPTNTKIIVWKRDKGRCVQCGSQENLHFDHIVPYSKGGTSISDKNIQLLCMKHNLLKKNKIL